jgi:hypothetical protein
VKYLTPLVVVMLAAVVGWSSIARPNHGLPAFGAGQAVAPPPGEGAVRFVTVDVFVESGAMGLAAWQIEVVPVKRDGVTVTLVGIEGGEHAAYVKPAYYDPAALTADEGGRVILAAYSTGKHLPTGHSRVARLHVMVEGEAGGQPEFTVKLKVAADAEGRAIDGANAAAAAVTEASNGGDR